MAQPFVSALDLGHNQLLNTRKIERVVLIASSATPSINADLVDMISITALAVGITGITVSGTPVDGQMLRIAILDNGTAQALALGASFENGNATIPSTTTASARMDLTFIQNLATGRWRCLAAPPSTSNASNGCIVAAIPNGVIGLSTSLAYVPYSGISNTLANEARNQWASPIAGTMKNLVVSFSSLGTTQPATGALTITVRRNGVNTALTVALAASASSPTPLMDLTHTVAIAIGDLITFGVVNAATSSSANVSTISFAIV